MKKIVLLFIGFVGLSMTIARAGGPNKGYRGYVDFAFGDAYNFNTNQLVSTNNMQLCSMISTTHGYQLNNWFVGGGVGYYHSFRDKENMYPIFAAGRYIYGKAKLNPYLETRAGIIYDPRWVHEVQAYGALSGGVSVYKRLQVGLRLSVFSRPSRYFTVNGEVGVSYALGNY